ncbi:MAG: hypothetical protein K0S32_1538 [Bacteroidetes bacterium]|nr:hypothetical protein [Bacteroidota bacterium]
MEMIKEFIKTLRENVAAIITACVIALLVFLYSTFIIPANEKKTNHNYHHKLEEFGNQVTSTIHDYANHVDSVATQALSDEILPLDSNNITDELLEQRRAMKDSLIDSGIIAESNLDSITSSPVYINIHRRLIASYHDNPLVLIDECNVPKEEIRKRLEGATPLKHWIIFKMKDGGAENLKSSVLLHTGLDLEEIDSLNLALKKPKDNFKIGDKQYFLNSILIKEQRLGIIGAEDIDKYNQQIQRFDANIIIICATLVILLLLIIPLIKPLISSVKERLTQFDMVSATVGICICSMLLSVAIFTFFFSSTGNEKIKKELCYTNQVYSMGIRNEFNSHKAASDLITNKFISLKQKTAHANIDEFAYNNFVKPTQTDGCFYSELPADISKQRIVTHFTKRGMTLPDVICEIDSSATMTWDITSKRSIRKNYKDRQYFKILQEDPAKKVVTAIYSRYDNSFKFTFIAQSKRSEILQHPLRGFVYKPFFRWEREDNSYGYMICDETGKVLLHSDTTKRLSENIYSCCHNANELSGFFRGEDIPFIKLDYDGQKHWFHGSRLFLGSGNPYETTPLYLFTFKNMQFEDDLNVYCISKAFVIAIAFGVLTGLLLLAYSVFLYHGSLSVFSKTHVYWLFPDRSRLREFKGLRNTNYIGCLVIGFCLWFFPDHALFLSMIIAINLAFVNFVLLSQRAFRIDVKSEEANKIISAFAIMMFVCIFLSCFLYHMNCSNLALTIFIIGHVCFLGYLRSFTKTVTEPPEQNPAPFENNRYRKFLASTMTLHYIVVPVVILFSLFALEKSKLSDIHLSIKAKSEGRDINFVKKVNYSEDLIFNGIEPTVSPSDKVKNQHNFQIHQYYKDMTYVRRELFTTENGFKVMFIVALLVIMVILLTVIAGFYTQRFFFFDLVILTKLKETVSTKFTNSFFIIPPFNDDDLKELEKNEIGPPYILTDEIHSSHVSSGKKLDLILNKALDVHMEEYVKLWTPLSDDEKFALYDFASDYFVNYKNKKHVASLIQKGLIISDPVTGRLRIMNYSFRNFIFYYEKKDPKFDAAAEENREKGVFARWRLPLLIIASSIIILAGIIYKEKSEQIIIYSGSIISAVCIRGNPPKF